MDIKELLNSVTKSEKQRNKNEKDKIAIIGLECQAADAKNADEYWNMLAQGRCAVTELSEGRKRLGQEYLNRTHRILNNKNYYKGAFLSEIEAFDCDFFSISPSESKLMSPEQRLFLENSYLALEDAGYGGKQIEGTRTGIYIGHCTDFGISYKEYIEVLRPDLVKYAISGNVNSIIAGRLAYILNLQGPVMLVDTACSSSLTAIHEACRALQRKECDMALAGAVKIDLLPLEAMKSEEDAVGITSLDGITRSFSENSGGTGLGEGVFTIVLKPLTAALEDRDHIYAVIKGSAVNNDGRSMSITAPNPEAQKKVLCEAWEDAGIDPCSIDYIEAHGTGTKLGDPIEVSGIDKAISEYTDHRQFCGLGSVKANIGHLDNAAGIAGLVKMVLALKNKMLPPLIHFDRPNRNIDFSNSALYVNDTLQPWSKRGLPRRCGISSFGLSGTNCHVVLEEFIREAKQGTEKVNNNIFTLSARTKNSLKHLARKYIIWLSAQTDIGISDMCYTANTSRGHYKYRAVVVFKTVEELILVLEKIIYMDLISENGPGLFWGAHRIVSDQYEREEGMTLSDKKKGTLAINKFLAACNQDELLSIQILESAAVEYCQGYDVDWNLLYKDKQLHTISLPVYSYERRFCWIEPEKEKVYSDHKFSDIFQVKWNSKELFYQKEPGDKEVIVYVEEEQKNIGVIHNLRARGVAIKEVLVRKNLHQSDSLFKIEKVVYIMGQYNDNEETSLAGDDSIAIINRLYKLMEELHNKSKVKSVLVVACYAFDVLSNGMPPVQALSTAVIGLIRVLRQEYPRLNIQWIDTDEYSMEEGIYNWIVWEGHFEAGAYREGKFFYPQIKKKELTQGINNATIYAKRGVYVITGGMGSVGLALAKHIAAQQKVVLVLIQRSEYPGYDQWERILKYNKDRLLCEKIKILVDIKSSGSEVCVEKADVASQEQMTRITEQIIEQFGRINGVFHLAGCADFGLFRNKQEHQMKEVLQPKIAGTKILDQLTKDQDLEFFVLYSSVCSFVPEAGQAYYSAANCFLDGYAQANKKRGFLSFNWSAWTHGGIAVEHGVEFDKEVFSPLPPETALRYNDMFIANKISNILPGEINYDNYMQTRQELYELTFEDVQRLDDQRQKRSKMDKQEIRLSGEKFESSYTSTHKNVAQVIGEVMGIPVIDIYQTFSEMGGNSIIAIRIEAEMEKRGIPLTAQHLEQYQSVVNISNYLKRIDITPFNEVFYRNCFMNALMSALDNLKIDLIPLMINNLFFYENDKKEDSLEIGGLETVYINSIGEILRNNRIIMQGQTHRIINKNSDYTATTVEINDLRRMHKEIGIPITQSNHSDDFEKDIKCINQAGGYVIIWIDCYYTPHRIDLYRKEHWYHAILVYDLDSLNNTINIIDQKYKDSLLYECMQVNLSDIIKGYSGYIINYGNHLDMPSFYSILLSKDMKCADVKYQDQYLQNLMRYDVRRVSSRESLRGILIRIKKRTEDEQAFIKSEFIFESTLNDIVSIKKIECYIFSKIFPENKELNTEMEQLCLEWEKVRSYLLKSCYIRAVEPVKRKLFAALEWIEKIEKKIQSNLTEVSNEN